MIALFSLLACKGPPEAPTNLEDIVVFGFSNFEEDPEVIEDLAINVEAWLDGNMEAVAEGYEVNKLKNEDLAAAGVEDPDLSGVVGAAVAYDYSVDTNALAGGISYPSQEEIFESYISFEMATDDDRDCFLAGSCEYFNGEVDLHIDLGALGLEMENTYTQQLRFVETDSLGTVMLHRNIGPEPGEVNLDIIRIEQQHSFSLAYDYDGVARRLHALWVEGEIVGADLPDSWALKTGINSMFKSKDDLDAWLVEQQ